MNLAALTIGIAIAIGTVWSCRDLSRERKGFVYALLLASFPLYYFVFAIFADDYSALANELIVGLLFFISAFIGYKSKSVFGTLVLAFGFIGHAFYDVAHNRLFINAGAPLWWPEFCGAVDGLMGLYLLYLAVTIKWQSHGPS